MPTTDDRTSCAHPRFAVHWLDLLLIVIFCAAFLGYRLGSFVPLTDHEAYVALGATEAADNGHWIVPYCNGQVRLQKTPLMYWAVATTGLLFGRIDEFVVRLPSAASATAVAVMMYLLAGRMFDRLAGIIAALALAGSAGILWQSHRGTADMLTTAFVVASMLCFYLAFEAVRSGRKSACWFALAYVAFAMGNLAKGPVPVAAVGLPVAVYVLWLGFFQTRPVFRSSGRPATVVKWVGSAVVNSARQLGRFQLHWGVIIVLVIVGGWAASVVVSLPDVVYRWREEYIARCLGQFGTKRAWHYYLPQLFLLTLPWSVFLPVGLTLPFRKDTADRRRELVFLFIWLVVGLVFFSIVKGKRTHYILPIVPAAIILSSGGMSFALRRWGSARNVVITTAIAFAVTIIAGTVAFFHLRAPYPQAMTGLYWLIGIVLTTEALVTLAFLRWGQLAAATVLAIGAGLCFTVVWPTYPTVTDPNRDPKMVAKLITERIGTDAEIHFAGRAHPQLVYYYGHNIPQIPSDQEITKAVLKARDKDQATLEIWETTVRRILDLLGRQGLRYVIASDDKLLTVRAYARANKLKINAYKVLYVDKYFTDTKGMVIVSNQPPKTTQPAARHPAGAPVSRMK